MAKGNALFDAVAISGTAAGVRAGRGGDASRAGCAVAVGVGGRGATADCNTRGCAGCAQGGYDNGGGVVRMYDGAVTFKGGSISDSTAVRAPSASCATRAVVWYVARCGTADGWRARCGARMLRRVVYGVRRMRPEWSVGVRLCLSLPKGQRHRDAECCTAACAARCACARHAPRGELSKRKDACIEAYL
jgi:hypothetical protein